MGFHAWNNKDFQQERIQECKDWYISIASKVFDSLKF